MSQDVVNMVKQFPSVKELLASSPAGAGELVRVVLNKIENGLYYENTTWVESPKVVEDRVVFDYAYDNGAYYADASYTGEEIAERISSEIEKASTVYQIVSECMYGVMGIDCVSSLNTNIFSSAEKAEAAAKAGGWRDYEIVEILVR
jgi:hypothetical protein